MDSTLSWFCEHLSFSHGLSLTAVSTGQRCDWAGETIPECVSSPGWHLLLAECLTWPGQQSQAAQIPEQPTVVLSCISSQLISIDALIWRRTHSVVPQSRPLSCLLQPGSNPFIPHNGERRLWDSTWHRPKSIMEVFDIYESGILFYAA